MAYYMNEGMFDLPEGWKDESIHVFKSSDGDDINLVVNRDQVPQGMGREEFIEQQLKQIRDNLGDYRENILRYVPVAGLESPLLDYNWSSPKGRMHQLNLMWVQPPVMVSFTFTSTAPIPDGRKEMLAALLQTFRPHTEENPDS